MGEGRGGRREKKKQGSKEGKSRALQKTNPESTRQSTNPGDSTLLNRERSALCSCLSKLIFEFSKSLGVWFFLCLRENLDSWAAALWHRHPVTAGLELPHCVLHQLC